MSTDINTVPVTSNGSLLETFGEYYRNRKSGNNTELLNNIFEEAERKVNPLNNSQNEHIFKNNKSVRAIGTKKAITLTTSTDKNTQLINQTVAQPKALKILKTIHTLGKRGGYAALAVGAVVGLCLLYKNYSNNS